MPTPLLNRYPDDPRFTRPPALERWHTALVAAVNGLDDSRVTDEAAIAFFASMLIAAGQIQFPAVQNPSSNANVLDDYEEGTWTPVDASGAGLALTTPLFGSLNAYVKIGRLVLVNYSMTYPATVSGLTARIGGLPFTADNTYCIGTLTNSNGGAVLAQVNANQTHFDPILPTGLAVATNANLSTAQLYGSVPYMAAA